MSPQLDRIHVITFSLRRDADDLSLGQLVALVSPALGCELVESDDERYGTDVFEGETLGVRIIVGEWYGIDRKRTFQMHGETKDALPQGTQLISLSIDDPIIELLARRGAGSWRVPSVAELEAESDYEAERDDY